MTQFYPSPTLYPSTTTFPGQGQSNSTSSSTASAIGVQVTMGSLSLTNVESTGIEWRTFAPLEGWDTSVSSSRQVTQKTRGPGGWSSPRNLAPRTIVLNGAVIAPTADLLQDAIDRLNAAVTIEDTVLTITRGAATRSVICARQDEVQWTEVSDVVHQWSLAVSCADPRKFASALVGTTGLPAVTGNRTFPATFPMTFPSVMNSGSISLTNPGNTTGPLVVRFDGTLTAPRIAHFESGLTWGTSQLIGSGDFLLVDMEANTAMLNGLASRNSLINSRQWLGFLPGPNTYYLTASAGFGQMTVTGTPAWL